MVNILLVHLITVTNDAKPTRSIVKPRLHMAWKSERSDASRSGSASLMTKPVFLSSSLIIQFDLFLWFGPSNLLLPCKTAIRWNIFQLTTVHHSGKRIIEAV